MVTGKIVKIREGKYRYFICNFNKKTDYAHNFEEKSLRLWWDKNEINDEIIRKKETDICRKFKFLFYSFLHLTKIWCAKWKLLHSNPKTFLEKLTVSNTRQIKSVYFEKSFTQFCRRLFKNQCFLATFICLWCTLTCLCTVISRSSLRDCFFVIVIDSELMPT